MSFNASTIAGCKLWLQGNLGLYDAVSGGNAVATTGNPVKRWEDQSGQGMHFTEETNPPIRQDSGAGGAVSLRFSGTGQLLARAHADAAALNTLQTGSYTFVWLISATSLANEIQSWFGKYQWADSRQFYCLYSLGAAPNRVSTVRRYRIFGGWQITEGVTGRLAVNTPYVISYTFAKTATNTGTETWRLNGHVIAHRTGAVPAVDASYPWQVGAGKAPGGVMWWFPGDVALAIAYDTALSDSNLSLAEDFARTYGNMAAFDTWLTDCRVVLDGDSLTFGVGSTDGLSYPAQLHTLLGRDLAFQNTGMASTLLSATTPSYDVLNSAITDNAILVVWYGSNNINAGTSAAATYTLLQNYCTAARNAGYDKIIVLTMCPRIFATDHVAKEAQRILFNQAIRDGFAGATLNCDAVADVGADANIGQPDSPGNAYYSEGTHLNNLGYSVVAGYVQAAITPFLPATAATVEVTVGGGGKVTISGATQVVIGGNFVFPNG